MLTIKIMLGIWFGISLGAMSIPLAQILGKKFVRWVFGRLPRRMPDEVLEAILDDVHAAPEIRRDKRHQPLIFVKGHFDADGVRVVDLRKLIGEN